MAIGKNQPTRQFTIIDLSKGIPFQPVEKVGFLDASGNPINPSHADTGASVLLTGYTAHAAGALAAADTANQAFAKLEARVIALESA